MSELNITKRDRFIYVWKIVWIILYVLFTAFQIYAIVDGYNSNLENINNTQKESSIMINSMGIVFAVIVVIIGTIGYSVLLLLSVIGFIVTYTNKESKYRKKNLIIFLCGSILPALTELILVLITMTLSNRINELI